MKQLLITTKIGWKQIKSLYSLFLVTVMLAQVEIPTPKSTPEKVLGSEQTDTNQKTYKQIMRERRQTRIERDQRAKQRIAQYPKGQRRYYSPYQPNQGQQYLLQRGLRMLTTQPSYPTIVPISGCRSVRIQRWQRQ